MFSYSEAGSKSLLDRRSTGWCLLLKIVEMCNVLVGPLMPILVSTFIGYWIGLWEKQQETKVFVPHI